MAAWRYEISLLVLKKYFTRSLRPLAKYFQHSKRNFVSPSGHVISSMSSGKKFNSKSLTHYMHVVY